MRERLGATGDHFVVMKAENGTISPVLLRAYQRSISSGCIRALAVPCTMTGRSAEPSWKSFTELPEKIVASIVFTSESETPIAAAFS